MDQPAEKFNPDRDRENCQTESLLERALNAPPRFSRRRFLATSTTASLAFALASQPGRLSADGTATESSGSNGDNPSNTGQPWTIKFVGASKGDGAYNGPECLEFNWKRAVGTLPSGMPYLLIVSWRLKPSCFIQGIGKKQNSWRYRLELLAQLRTNPGPRPNPLPEGAEEYMVVNGQYYQILLLDAGGSEGGNIDIQVDKDVTPMTCVLTLANDVNDSEEVDINGTRVILVLHAKVNPGIHTPAARAGTLQVQVVMGAGVSATPIPKAGSKVDWGLELKLSPVPVKLTFKGGSPPQSSYTDGVSTSFLSTFQAVLGAPDYSCSFP